MAEKIQERLEEMLPDLEALQIAGVFTQQEIKAIIKKRRHFEYLVNRHTKEKTDYLQYIQYEISLEVFKRRRMRENKIKNVGSAQFSGMTRIKGLFNRVLLSHPGDVKLWLQYIDYLLAAGANALLGSVFGSALSLHPHHLGLWILSANWEFSQNNNPLHARKLLQRAIRVNPHSSALYIEYCRLELMNLNQILERRSHLESTEAKEKEAQTAPSEGIDLEMLPEDATQTTVAVLPTEGPRATHMITTAVYQAAIESIPRDFSVRAKFIPMLRSFEGTEEAISAIYDDIATAFPDHVEAIAFHSLMPFEAFQSQKLLKSADLSEEEDHENPAYFTAVAEAIQRWNTHLQHNMKATELVIAYLSWLESIHVPKEMVQFAILLENTLNDFYADFEAHKAIEAPVALKLALVCLKHGLVAKAESVLDIGTQRIPHHQTLWAQRLVLARLKQDKNHMNKLFHQAIAAVPESLAIYQEYLIYLMSSEPLDFHNIEKLYSAALAFVSKMANALAFKDSIIDAAIRNLTPSEARTLYKITLPYLPLSPEFYQKCLQFELSMLTADAASITNLFNESVAAYGTQNDDLWLQWIAWLQSRGEFKSASLLYFQAVRTLKSPEQFILKHNQLTNGETTPTPSK